MTEHFTVGFVNGRRSRINPVVLRILDDVIKNVCVMKGRDCAVDVWRMTTLRVSEENRVRQDGEQLKAPSQSTVRRRIKLMPRIERRNMRKR